MVSPYAAAGTRREPLIAGLCLALIAGVYLLEITTPDDYVLIDLALLPLLAAMWLLSSRLAAIVAVVAGLLFLHELVIDDANRTTVVFLGVTMFATGLLARLHATGLAAMILNRRHAPGGTSNSEAAGSFQRVERPSGGIRSLTQRQLEVARLAAQGLTSREIGSQLNIGPRTVETHLASAYSKLRISSRVELARIAGRLARNR